MIVFTLSLTFSQFTLLQLLSQQFARIDVVMHRMKKTIKTLKLALEPGQSQQLNLDLRPIKFLLKNMVNINLNKSRLFVVLVMRISTYRTYPIITSYIVNNYFD